MGTIGSETHGFPIVRCPNCHEETYNFDDFQTVEANDREEGGHYHYNESIIEVVGHDQTHTLV
jgi:hypothetical protein